jgi:hypothetical protein
VSVDAGPAWAAWATVTPVAVAPARRERYVRVAIPFTIAPNADGGYPDLRVVDGNGTEVAYAIDPRRAASAPREIALIDRGFVPHRWTQAVLDLGARRDLVDTIRLGIDEAAPPTYFETVAIDASDDHVTWRVVRDDAIVYRVAQDAGRGDRTISFAPTRSRWLRVRVLDPRAQFPLTGASIEGGAPAEPALVPLPIAGKAALVVTTHDPTPKFSQEWSFDSPVAIRPAAVSFRDRGQAYARHAVVQSSDDGTQWSDAGDAQIARFADGGAQTSFAFGEQTARHWRVAVDNGNDRPVEGLQPVLLARKHDVVFSAVPAATYRLLSGNAAAGAPAYDLGERLAHGTWHADRAATQAALANASFRDQRPLADRVPPWSINAALGVVAALLGLLAIRTVRTARAK